MSECLQNQIFIDQGYVIYRELYSKDEISKIQDLTHSLLDMAKDIDYPYDGAIHKTNYHGTQFVLQYKENETVIHRIVWAAGAQPELLNFSRDPKLLGIISELLGTNRADHLINSIHPKLPHDSIEYTIHQDEFHRRKYDPNWVNVKGDLTYTVSITAIDSMNAENGGIYLIPYSHKNGFLSADELNQLNLDQAIAPALSPGDTICMHQDLVHFSLPNESASSRIILINGFSVVGANHSPYPGEGSAQTIDLV